MSEPQPFDLAGDLPVGLVTLEASAGTGKTFSISGLVARHVAEGTDIGAILVVTFTKAAAAELRDRIRTKLEDCRLALAAVMNDRPWDDQDPVLTRVCDSDVEVRYLRFEAALADFDTAFIGTIHSFAQSLLAEQGSSSGTNPDAVLVEDISLIVEQATADVLSQRGVDGEPFVKPEPVSAAVKVVLQRETASIFPTRAEVEVTDRKKARAEPEDLAELAEVVEAVVERVGQIRSNRAVLGFDDILVLARDLAVSPASRAGVQRSMDRIDVALIDEFQDTDGVQWQLLHQLFGNKSLTLVGDPKQSIYRFRGADINSYLEAVKRSDHSFTLANNYRSDQRMLDGVEAFLRDASFGDERIRFVPVGCGREGLGHLETSRGCRSGLELRIVPNLAASAPVADAQIAHDVAVQIVDLLNTGATIPDENTGEIRPLRPGDIAVLVKAHSIAPAIQRNLRLGGVQSVVGKVGSVMKTEAALQLLTLLRAVAFPASERRVRAAAVGWFIAQEWDRLEQGYERNGERRSVVADLQSTFSEWSDILQTEGLAAFLDRVWQHNDLAARLVRQGEGQRKLTDLNHIREILQSDGGPTQINRVVERLEVLMSQEETEEGETELFARRTDSDDDAVQIMTVHASKGLEFGVVFSVGLHKKPVNRGPSAVDDAKTGRRVRLVGKSGWNDADFDDRTTQELDGELQRLIYVALTRSRHLGVITLGSKGAHTPLTGLFTTEKLKNASEVVQLLEPRVRASSEAFRTVVIDPGAPLGRWERPDDGPSRTLATAEIDRTFDREPRRWSFTRVSGYRVRPDDHTEAGSAASLGVGAPESGVTDEATPDGLTVDDSDATGSDLPLGNITGGAAFGTLVHDVLEQVDFAASDLRTEVAEHVGTAVRWSNWQLDTDELVDGLLAAIDTPLGPLFEHRSMRTFGPDDVLDEMNFELPLAPACSPEARPTGADVGALIRRHMNADDPLAGWADGLASGEIDVRLAGHLTGAIDGIFRVTDPAGHDRFVVVDYKTNRLGTYGEPLLAASYDSAGMVEGMVHHDYPLQALLYSVALHRYLRWRMADRYDPKRHLGGAAYLFVRGMVGPNTPTSGGSPQGVFSWAIPPRMVTELSDLLHHGVERAVLG